MAKSAKWIVTYLHEDGREEEMAYNRLDIMEEQVEYYEDEPWRIDAIIQIDIDGIDIKATDITGRYFK